MIEVEKWLHVPNSNLETLVSKSLHESMVLGLRKLCTTTGSEKPMCFLALRIIHNFHVPT